MSSRSYLSIGDVLTLLRLEFPDVTISKIRFLESQGLVNPERTPSGYRKFYEHDVERLRWVLRQQREHFLPLKVIKDRLDEDVSGTAPDSGSAKGGAADPETHNVNVPASVTAKAEAAAAQIPDEAAILVGPGTTTVEVTREATSGRSGIDASAHLRTPVRATVGTPAISGGASIAVTPVATVGPVERAHRASMSTQPVPSSAQRAEAPAANGTANLPAVIGPTDQAVPAEPAAEKSARSTPRRPAGSASPPATVGGTRNIADSASGNMPAAAGGGTTNAGLGGASLSLEDLCSASGLTAKEIALLQEYALLSSTVAAGVEFFDEEALAVANLSAKFARFGIEARHLRLYKNAADREAGFIEQIVIPMVRQRNPEARARATLTAEDLSNLGQQLKASLLLTALRNIL